MVREKKNTNLVFVYIYCFNQDEITNKKKTEILMKIIWIESHQAEFIIMYQTVLLLKH